MPSAMSRMRRAPAVLAACLGVAACIGPQELDQPLSPMVLRSALVGRVIVAEEGGQSATMRLGYNGIAARNGPDIAEYGRWWTGASGLCLWWHGQPERCAPVYAAAGAHYRWGDTDLSVLGRRR